MKSKIQVVGVNRRENVFANKSGAVRTSVSFQCKCIFVNPDTGEVDTGTLRVPEKLAALLGPDGLHVGEYWVDFQLSRGFQDDAIVARLCSLEPVAKGATVVAADVQKADVVAKKVA